MGFLAFLVALFFFASLVYWIDRSDLARPDLPSGRSEDSDAQDEYPRAA